MPEQFTYERADLLQSNAERRREVKADDLPVVCPTPDSYLWSSHPKVFLPVHESGEETCPYCGTVFSLADEDSLAVTIKGQREWK
ncbi:zinc-finger domain-containing protein [Halorhodospira halochloris]|uniref:Zinc finger CHCC-type domain-containing protein n=1 Tax=Halorhodospira halochloris TaxID=1052 RepID=A0A0X8X8F4_HALHR|nr:zinc-finger domain-containing protein [Halorhodospira halochloris]MBK1650645.1 hypothetical protein [Halorhodospira halochloris]MCG5529753.1 zinc-finger domain-containing protein [Halorhodospira halochloris]MCG5549062.1 zinc-finger domain-containing protein [Halorhodospira halochloris]BAU56868.1 hypothetical protein HH1059_01940 [Halorhodospira halochloris]